MAAGMSIARENYQAFSAAFDAEVRRQLSAEDLQALILSDGELAPTEFNLTLAQTLRDAGPWGQHFPEPTFDGEFYILQQRLVGEKHLKLQLAHSADNPSALGAIAFNIDPAQWPNNAVKKIRIAYRLDVNEFRGQQKVQLMVEYLELVN